MLLPELWTWLESQPVSEHIGATWWFPLLESIHIVAATFVLGSILMVDLRLLGLAARRHPLSRIIKEVVPWTIGAFAVAAVAGFGLFVTQASRYAGNRAFQVKVVLLVLAVANMAAFHLITRRGIAAWDTTEITSASARLAGGLSLALWVGVMLAGRWVGHLL
jgi:hypothetical protein